MKKFLSSLITLIFLAIMIGAGIFVFSMLLTQGLLYTFHINLNLYGVYLLSLATMLGLGYLINMFKN